MQPSVTVSSLDPRRWWALAVMVAAQFIYVLDAFIVNVAVPAIRADLRPGWNLFDGRGLDWLVGTAAEKVRGGFVTLEKRLDLEA